MLSIEVESCSTQRTRTGVARLEPLEQAARMEEVLARLAALRRQLLVGRNDRVANGALGLAFQCAGHVLAPGRQAIGDAAILRCCQHVDRLIVLPRLTENVITPWQFLNQLCHFSSLTATRLMPWTVALASG